MTGATRSSGDDYRILARVDKGQCRLLTRNGNDWTDKMQGLAGTVAKLPLTSGWLDCEAVVLGASGLKSFNALQNAFERVGPKSVVLGS